jgi:transposase
VLRCRNSAEEGRRPTFEVDVRLKWNHDRQRFERRESRVERGRDHYIQEWTDRITGEVTWRKEGRLSDPGMHGISARLDVHVILDNCRLTKTPTVQKWLLRHRRFHLHFTPTYGPWMNLVERWFGALTTKKLQRSAHRSVNELAADIEAWAATWNENPTPFVWHKTAEEILERLAGYCSAINHQAST